MPDYIEHPIDAGDLGTFTLHWTGTNGVWLFVGLEMHRLDLSAEDSIHALWGVVNTWSGRTYPDHEAAVKRWIGHRLEDALEARASAKDEAADEAAHHHMESADAA